MTNILIYPRDRRAPSSPGAADPVPATQTDASVDDPLMGLGWLIAAVGFLCMLSAIGLATLNLA